MSGVLLRLALGLALLALPQAGLAARTHALLIGSGEYRSEEIRDLAGPANDIRAMRALLGEIGTDRLVVLENADVTRSAVERALFDLGRAAAPGDWVLLYYSGHGAQAVMPGTNKVLQFVPLPGFDPDHQDPEHFIADKDFYAWMKLYVPRTVNILMMVDSCHSGTMQRTIRPQLYGYVSRATLGGSDRPITIEARPGPRFASSQGAAGVSDEPEPVDLPNLVYFGAAKDGQLALEMELPAAGGASRGLLTYAFEQGLTRPGSRADRPAADLDNDGVVSIEEMAAYLNGQVHLLSAFRQDSTATFAASLAGAPLLSEVPPAPRPAGEAIPSLHVVPDLAPEGGGTPADQALRIVGEDQPADFRWDRTAGKLYRRSGDLVAEDLPSLAAVAGTLEKWRTIAALSPLAAERAIRLKVAPGGFDWLHEPGARIAVSLERLPGWRDRTLYATVFNLASDGTVQLIYPLGGEDGKLDQQAGERGLLELEVTAPFGTDHLVAVMTDRPADYLLAALRAADRTRAAARVVRPVQHELQQAGAAGSLAIFELYTGT